MSMNKIIIDFVVCLWSNVRTLKWLLFFSSVLVFLGEDLLTSVFYDSQKIHPQISSCLVYSHLKPSSDVTSSEFFLIPVGRYQEKLIFKHFSLLLSFHVYLYCLSPPVNCIFMFCKGNPLSLVYGCIPGSNISALQIP